MSVLTIALILIYLGAGLVYYIFNNTGEVYEGFFEEWMVIFLWGPIIVATIILFGAIGIVYIFQKPVLKIRHWYLKKRE